MDFLGRVEAAVVEMARHLREPAPTEPEKIVVWFSVHCDAGRPAHLRLGASLEARTPLDPMHPLTKEIGDVLRESSPEIARAMIQYHHPPVDLLWHHWEMILERRIGLWQDNDALLDELWSVAFSRQSAGYLHALGPETLLDAFAYDELCAVHAAYQSALALKRPDMMEQVRRMVEWHVANTQPDHTTAEPWGMAAFAALDETGTFAEQQLHDATTAATKEQNPVILALLADAVLAMREARGMSLGQ